MVTGMEMVPEGISKAFKQEKKVIGGRGPQLVDIVKMLQLTTSLEPTFMCIDGPDACTGVQLVRVLGSLN